MKYIKPLNETAPLGGNHKKDYSDEMSYGQLERCIDYAHMIRERIEQGQSLDAWMHSQIAIAENELNSVFGALDGDDGIVENKKKPGPDAYMTGLSDEDEEEKEEQMKKQAAMDDDNPEAYKEMPGDVEAREKGKVKTSKYVKRYHELYGDAEKKNERLTLTEGVMGDLHQMAADVTDADQFVNGFFKKYGSKVKKTADSIQWVKSLYHDIVDESLTEAKRSKVYKAAKEGSFPAVIVVVQNGKVIHQENVNTPEVAPATFNVMQERYPNATLHLEDNTGKRLFTESVVTEDKERKQSTDRTPLEDDAMETGLKRKADETGVPIGIIRAVARRGLAAWKTGHRPGATQQQWAYARVNSFLTKQPGTWGGADADLAKEVRDGGHDKKLKKG